MLQRHTLATAAVSLLWEITLPLHADTSKVDNATHRPHIQMTASVKHNICILWAADGLDWLVSAGQVHAKVLCTACLEADAA